MEMIQKIAKEIIKNLGVDFFKWCAGYFLASGLLSSAWAFMSQKFSDSDDLLAYMVIFSATLLLFLSFYQKCSKFRPAYPKLPCAYYAKTVTKKMIIPASGQIQYRASYELISLTDQLEKIQHKFFWTGGFDNIYEAIHLETEEDKDNYSFSINEEKSGIWSVYTVYIHKSIKKGDRMLFSILFNLNDATEKTYKSFIGANIEYPVDRLHMQLIAPKSKKVSLKWAVSFNHIVDKHIDFGDDFVKQPDDFNNYIYTKTFEKPKLLHNYKIYWNK